MMGCGNSRRRAWREAAGQTLQPTALVHEAWLRLVGDGDRSWENRVHFFGAAAEAMRRILIENARRKSRLKRGGDQVRVELEELDLAATTPDDNILLIDEALERLKAEDPGDGSRGRLKILRRADERGDCCDYGHERSHRAAAMELCQSVVV
jgi:RNA polymerase sigma factor (TIGR02999 family)